MYDPSMWIEKDFYLQGLRDQAAQESNSVMEEFVLLMADFYEEITDLQRLKEDCYDEQEEKKIDAHIKKLLDSLNKTFEFVKAKQ